MFLVTDGYSIISQIRRCFFFILVRQVSWSCVKNNSFHDTNLKESINRAINFLEASKNTDFA